MKILLCSEFFYPNIGGVQKHNEILAEYFYKKGHEIHLATSYIKNRQKFKHIKYHEFDITGNIVRGYRGETINYQNFLIFSKFDVIFFNAAQQWTFDLSLSIIEKIKSKKVFFPCGFSRINNPLYYFYFLYVKSKINYFDEIICSHKKAKDSIFLKNIYKKKIHFLNNGAQRINKIYTKTNFFKKYNIPKKNKVICNISNYKYFKGQDISIKIFSELKEDNITLIMIGKNLSPLFYFYLKYKVEKFNLSHKNKNIILTSPNYNEAMTILSLSDVFLFTSRLEYDPLVIYESIIHNTKFVSTKVGLINFLNKKFGYSSNNMNTLIKYLKKYINQKKNHNIDKKKYEWKNILKKYEKIFHVN